MIVPAPVTGVHLARGGIIINRDKTRRGRARQSVAMPRAAGQGKVFFEELMIDINRGAARRDSAWQGLAARELVRPGMVFFEKFEKGDDRNKSTRGLARTGAARRCGACPG